MANPFRAAARQMPPLQQRGRRASTWDGADTGRLYADWEHVDDVTGLRDPVQFRLLRARARAMARNNPWIVGFLDELANNVVGPHGILLQAQIKNALGKLAKATNDEIEAGWEEWGYPENASADGHDSWIELQRLIIQTIAIDGECFVRRIRGADNPFGYTLQLIDADLVDETYNVPPAPNRTGSGWASSSIATVGRSRTTSTRGTPRTWTASSGNASASRRRDLHLFVRWHRGNTTRGITWFAPIVAPARHLDRVRAESHRRIARGAAAKMAVIINKIPKRSQRTSRRRRARSRGCSRWSRARSRSSCPGRKSRPSIRRFPAQNYESSSSPCCARSRAAQGLVSHAHRRSAPGELLVDARGPPARARSLARRCRSGSRRTRIASSTATGSTWPRSSARSRSTADSAPTTTPSCGTGAAGSGSIRRTISRRAKLEIELGINSRTRAQRRTRPRLRGRRRRARAESSSTPTRRRRRQRQSDQAACSAAQPEEPAGSGNAEETGTDSTDTVRRRRVAWRQ
jgi:hypothetical protein